MPVDLDELFDAVRQQADTIPLAGAEPARTRARHRTQMHLAVTVAVAVTLVVVGTGVAMSPLLSSRHDQPAAPPIRTPLTLVGGARDARVMTDGKLVYTVWNRKDDDTLWLAATDARTGAVVWAPRQVDRSAAPDDVVILPKVIMVIGKAQRTVRPNASYWNIDARTGAVLSGLGIEAPEALLTGDHVTVLEAPHGSASLNSLSGAGYLGPAGHGHTYARMLGWGTPADEEQSAHFGRAKLDSAVFTDPRAVLVTHDGTADVIDTDTGRTQRSVPLGSVPGPFAGTFDGTLFMTAPHDQPTGPQHVQFVDLSGGNGGRWESGPVTGQVVALNECGPGRVCLVTAVPGQRDLITAFDIRQRRVAWQVHADFAGVQHLSSRGGRTLVVGPGGFDLYDEGGRRIVAGAGSDPAWQDAEQWLVITPGGVLNHQRFDEPGPRPTTRVPSGALDCTSTSTRVICATATAVTTVALS